MIDATRSRRSLALSMAGLVLAALTGCSGGLRSDSPAVQIYYLRAAHAPAAQGGASAQGPAAGSLQVLRPVPTPGLASDAIVVVQPDRRLDAFAASRWSASLPEVVESLVTDAIRSRGDFATVVDSRSAFPADWLLQVRIRRFDAEYVAAGAAPRAVVALDCTLGRRSDREVVASFAAEGAVHATDNRLGAVVAAFEQAAATAIDVLAARSAEAVRRSTAPSPP